MPQCSAVWGRLFPEVKKAESSCLICTLILPPSFLKWVQPATARRDLLERVALQLKPPLFNSVLGCLIVQFILVWKLRCSPQLRVRRRSSLPSARAFNLSGSGGGSAPQSSICQQRTDRERPNKQYLSSVAVISMSRTDRIVIRGFYYTTAVGDKS